MLYRRSGFTLVDSLVVLTVVMMGVALFMVMISNNRRNHDHPRQTSQLRGIHTALVLFSQGNNTYYPGFNTLGKPSGDTSVEARFKQLLDDNYFTPEYLISPAETKSEYKTGQLTAANFSYALLNLSDDASPRKAEWRDTSNSEAVVASDRAIGNGKNGAIRSIHSKPRKNKTQWQGEVAFNDNHVTFEASHDQLNTQYGEGAFENDNLFDTVGASMVYEGVDKIVDNGS